MITSKKVLKNMRSRVKLYIMIVMILYFAVSFLSNYWLIKNAFKYQIYVHGTLPIHQSYPYNPFLAWNEFLSTTRGVLIPFSHLLSNINFFEPNVAWTIHEFLFPIIGGFFMYLLVKEIILSIERKRYVPATVASSTVGIIYELVLLSRYTDYWIRGTLTILPAAPLLSLITFNAIRNKDWKKARIFALLTAIFLSALYDWRLQVAGLILVFIFPLMIMPLSSIINILREKKFWLIAILCLSTWCITWLIPHVYAIYLYSLSHTRGITLPVIVGDYSLTSAFGLYSPDEILRALYLILICVAFSSILYCSRKSNYRYRKFILITSFVLIFQSLIIWENSPLKFIHYLLTSLSFNGFDIGTLFRTRKLFTAIALPLFFSLLGFSIYKLLSLIISERFKISKISKILSILLIYSLICSLAFQVINVNNSQEVTIIPQEYFDVAQWLKSHQNSYRTLWLPRTGRYPPGENPTWFKTKGWGAPETSLGVRTYYYYGTPMAYFYSFLMRLLEANKTKSAAYMLSIIGVKYLAIHNDYWWGSLREKVEQIKENLDSSPYFRLEISTDNIYVYNNLMTSQAVYVAESSIIINGGLRALSLLIESTDINPNDYVFFFSDLPIPKDAVYSTQIFIASDLNDLKNDLLANLLISERKENYIIIPAHFTKGIEKGVWHPYYIDNPHHAEWEIFHSWNYPNSSFEHSFKFSWGFVGSATPGDKLEIPIYVKDQGDYTILVRYFKNEKGGEIEIKVNDENAYISTLGSENAFKWFVANFSLAGGSNTICIRNIKGRNAINIIIVLPSEEFLLLSKEIDKILERKKVFLLADLKKGIANDLKFIGGDVIVQSVEYKNGAYILKVLAKTDNVSLGITIPEQYHGGWMAFVDKNQKISSTPHMFVNTFWIRLKDAGLHEIKVEFAPQSLWMIIYVLNCCITISILVLFTIYFLRVYLSRKWAVITNRKFSRKNSEQLKSCKFLLSRIYLRNLL